MKAIQCHYHFVLHKNCEIPALRSSSKNVSKGDFLLLEAVLSGVSTVVLLFHFGENKMDAVNIFCC